jgi:hypothetical protein
VATPGALAPVDLVRDMRTMPERRTVDTSTCCHDDMTTPRALRPLPECATVVDVHGSRFLLEWLDRDTLASAAAMTRHPHEPDTTKRSAAT